MIVYGFFNKLLLFLTLTRTYRLAYSLFAKTDKIEDRT